MQQQTTPLYRASAPTRAPAGACEHGWLVESRHATSLGAVLYVRCAACGARRVDLERRATEPPEAASVVVA